ncbi:MAG TPA: tetratricopeptide repeat protein [Noviherbaspirillum sp.]
MRATSLLLALTLGLAGCASSGNYEAASAALNVGDLMRAERLYAKAIRDGEHLGRSWLGLGNVFYQQRRHVEAVNAWQVAARWGEVAAHKKLAALGVSIPEADLQVAAGTSSQVPAGEGVVANGAAAFEAEASK